MYFYFVSNFLLIPSTQPRIIIYLRTGCRIASAQQVTVSNDVCNAAAIISSLPFSTTLNISTATSDGQSCDRTKEDDIGVWYTYKSENDAVVEVRIDDSRSYYRYRVEFAAFEGSCDNLICLNRIPSVEQGLWVAYAGVEYHLLISRKTFLTDSFTFKLSVSGIMDGFDKLSYYCSIHTFYFTRILKGLPTMIVNQQGW